MKPSSFFLLLAALCACMLAPPAADAQPPGMGRGRGRGAAGSTPQDQAKYHRLMADLIEAKAADSPDQDQIDKLTKELQALEAQPSAAGPGPGRGFGWRGGRGESGGPGGPGGGRNDPAFTKDREMFHYLLSHRDAIRRTVTQIANGVETVTESDDPEVAATIRHHVESMHARIQEGRPIHMRDPLFAAVFANAPKITMEVEPTEKGARVVETSSDPYVARLIQAHAEVVNQFVAHGFAEVSKNHSVPERPAEPRQ